MPFHWPSCNILFDLSFQHHKNICILDGLHILYYFEEISEMWQQWWISKTVFKSKLSSKSNKWNWNIILTSLNYCMQMILEHWGYGKYLRKSNKRCKIKQIFNFIEHLYIFVDFRCNNGSNESNTISIFAKIWLIWAEVWAQTYLSRDYDIKGNILFWMIFKSDLIHINYIIWVTYDSLNMIH